MNRDLCAFVDTWLDDWLAGRLPADAARRIDAHVAGCDRCRRLAAVVRGAEATSDVPDAEVDLLAPVLDRTSGSACSRAEQLLPALADNELEGDSADILRDHLSHCDACAQLLAVLRESRTVLPALAEIRTPPGLVERVLDATSRRERPSPFVEWWLRILARPRASLELAYVATVLMVVLLGNPIAAFNGARERAGRLAGVVPVARLSEQLPISGETVGTIGRFLDGVASAANDVVREVEARWQQALTWLNGIETAVSDAITWLRGVDLVKLLRDAGQALNAGGQPVAQEPSRKQ